MLTLMKYPVIAGLLVIAGLRTEWITRIVPHAGRPVRKPISVKPKLEDQVITLADGNQATLQAALDALPHGHQDQHTIIKIPAGAFDYAEDAQRDNAPKYHGILIENLDNVEIVGAGSTVAVTPGGPRTLIRFYKKPASSDNAFNKNTWAFNILGSSRIRIHDLDVKGPAAYDGTRDRDSGGFNLVTTDHINIDHVGGYRGEGFIRLRSDGPDNTNESVTLEDIYSEGTSSFSIMARAAKNLNINRVHIRGNFSGDFTGTENTRNGDGIKMAPDTPSTIDHVTVSNSVLEHMYGDGLDADVTLIHATGGDFKNLTIKNVFSGFNAAMGVQIKNNTEDHPNADDIQRSLCEVRFMDDIFYHNGKVGLALKCVKYASDRTNPKGESSEDHLHQFLVQNCWFEENGHYPDGAQGNPSGLSILNSSGGDILRNVFINNGELGKGKNYQRPYTDSKGTDHMTTVASGDVVMGGGTVAGTRQVTFEGNKLDTAPAIYPNAASRGTSFDLRESGSGSLPTFNGLLDGVGPVLDRVDGEGDSPVSTRQKLGLK